MVSKQVCQQNNIYFDTSSIERIYNDPESTLADPQAFLSQDPAYALLAESRARGADPFQYESFVSAYNSIADENMGLRYGGKP